MSRINIHTPGILLLLCGLLSSCLENIDLDTGEHILDVYCILNQGPEQELDLSYIVPAGGGNRPIGEDVSISLYDEENLVGKFSRVSETKWNLDFSPQGGCTYRLEIKVSGEEQLTAETKFPPISTLQEYYLYKDEETDGEPIKGYFQTFELVSEEDQILWCLFENRESGQTFSDYVSTDHPGLDVRGESVYTYESLRRDYYCSLGSFPESPPLLHEKVVRIMHPAGFCRSNEPVTKYYLDENRQIIHQEEGEAGMFCFLGVNKFPMRSDLVIRSVSSEYDAYLRDYYFGRYDSDDFAISVYKRNHYTNIKNGTGIFGGIIEYRRENLDVNFNQYNLTY